MNKYSLIGFILNLVFWFWTILLSLDHNNYITFPRYSLGNKQYIIYYTVGDNFIANFMMTIFNTIFNTFLMFYYPEMLFCFLYAAYIIYSIMINPAEKFKDQCFLTKKVYILFVLLSLGEIYKLFARKWIDIY